jgi:predicted metal-dependent hydrolase
VEGSIQVDDLEVLIRVSERRRRVRLTVERDATVTATVPPGVERAELTLLIRSRRRWLYGKLAERRSLGEARPQRRFVTGEGFFYLGRSHRLLIVDSAPARVRLIRGRVEIRRDALDGATEALIDWYTERGESWIPDRIHPWAERMRASYDSLKVMPLGLRWGSCSSRGRLNLHWATMQLPPDLIDYVLVHELAHLHVPDHSERFWRRVEVTMPDCAARRARLKRLGPDLWLPELAERTSLGAQ